MGKALQVNGLGKMYRLGTISTGTLSHDLNRFWHKMRGKEDPYATVGQLNDRSGKAGENPYVWALKDVSFDVNEGDVLGIIGRNGAGKSTLLKILSKITAPTSGEIKVRGRIASLLEVGTGFHPELTGRENIYLNGAILGMRRREIQKKFDEIVDFSGCEKYIDTPVKRYSSGMYVRLAFAVAAHLESEILIVDEVLAVGDAEFQKKCIGKMQDVSSSMGRTVLFVSHDLNAMARLCPNALLMNSGHIYAQGTTFDMIGKYFGELGKKPPGELQRTGSRQIRLTDIQLLDHDLNEAKSLGSGMPFTIRIRINVLEDVAGAHFAVTLKNAFGTKVTSSWTNFSGQQIDIRKGETHRIDFHFSDLSMVPGEYSVISYINAGNEVIEMIDDVLLFSVLESGTSAFLRYPTISEGLVISRSEIQSQKE
ncbi:MAG: ABC transporter ATP-binding protein [Bacteroidia bacterium]|nr:ABC transporter ATP-binding protein [Bacteroidia bacterium]